MVLWTKNMLCRLKQGVCSHTGVLSDLKRRPDGLVECPCLKCKKVLVASYGLALNIKWESES